MYKIYGSVYFIILLVYVVIKSGQAQSDYTIMGDILTYTEDRSHLTFNCDNGSVKISFLTDDLLRIHMSPDGNFPSDGLHLNENGPYAVVNYSWPGVSYKILEKFDYDLEGHIYQVSAGKLIVKVRKSPFKLAFYDSTNGLLVTEKPGIVNAGLGYAETRVFETMALDEDEHFFGFGAYNNPLDMRGQQMICYAKELEKHHDSGGFPVPFFYST